MFAETEKKTLSSQVLTVDVRKILALLFIWNFFVYDVTYFWVKQVL